MLSFNAKRTLKKHLLFNFHPNINIIFSSAAAGLFMPRERWHDGSGKFLTYFPPQPRFHFGRRREECKKEEEEADTKRNTERI